MKPLPRSVLLSAFARCFVIQSSWNYHTMLGSGFAFALLPVLRHLAPDSDALERAVDRHLELFNAHPYLSGVAVGAVARMEAEGAPPEVIRRFKTAVRGPLGSLGDGLVWASLVPAFTLLALALLWSGVPAWLAVAAFLLLYNAVHLGLRIWGFRVGLREGVRVGTAIQSAGLGQWTQRIRSLGTLLLGFLVGLLLTSPDALPAAGLGWTALAGAAFLAGALLGHRAWRPSAAAVVGAVGIAVVWGMAFG